MSQTHFFIASLINECVWQLPQHYPKVYKVKYVNPIHLNETMLNFINRYLMMMHSQCLGILFFKVHY
ncbi:Uncharacterised protein [Staphylococcus agnetis]|nr:Uncharacterised protein [Staphylococcus agnetis]